MDAAQIIDWIRSNPVLLSEKIARDWLRELSKIIRDTEWHGVLGNNGKTEEEEARIKKLRGMVEDANLRLPRIEKFFNTVFPNIDWSEK